MLLAVLRGVPLLRRLEPAPRVPECMAPATYWVPPRSVPASSRGYLSCYEAVLPGAAP